MPILIIGTRRIVPSARCEHFYSVRIAWPVRCRLSVQSDPFIFHSFHLDATIIIISIASELFRLKGATRVKYPMHIQAVNCSVVHTNSVYVHHKNRGKGRMDGQRILEVGTHLIWSVRIATNSIWKLKFFNFSIFLRLRWRLTITPRSNWKLFGHTHSAHTHTVPANSWW